MSLRDAAPSPFPPVKDPPRLPFNVVKVLHLQYPGCPPIDIALDIPFNAPGVLLSSLKAPRSTTPIGSGLVAVVVSILCPSAVDAARVAESHFMTHIAAELIVAPSLLDDGERLYDAETQRLPPTLDTSQVHHCELRRCFFGSIA